MRRNKLKLMVVAAGYALGACADGGIPTAPGSTKSRVTPPAAPVIVEVVPGSRRVAIEFTAPLNDGGSQVTGYDYSIDTGTSWVSSPAALSAGSITVDSLENGRTYTIALRAINAAGPGPSANASATPSTIPSQVRITGIAPGDKFLAVAFANPDSGGSRILHYEYSVEEGSRWAEEDTTELASPIIIQGLTNGRSYAVRVRAINGSGAGPASEAVLAVPMSVPAAPVLTGVVPGIDKLTIGVRAADENAGSAVTGFEYSIDAGQHWASTGELEQEAFDITGLSWEVKYEVRVRAVNAVGAGAYSVTTAVPLGLAAAPTLSAVTAGDEQLTLIFVAPSHFGGAELSAWEYSFDSGATWSVSSADLAERELKISGLRNGDEYHVALRAVTSSGAGAASGIVAGMPFVVSPAIDTLRSTSKPGKSYYMPQMLDARDPSFDADVERALQRYRALHGRDAVTLFEKVQAAADYVSNMAKHPYRHNLGKEYSDPRTWEYQDSPVKLAELAKENQQWNGLEWVPAEGKTWNDVPAIECSFQDLILGGLVNALGAQWMLLGITHHDAFTYYDNQFGKWVYIEASYNEHYRSAGSSADDYVPLSPKELRDMNLAGDNSMIAVQHPYQPKRTEPEYYLFPYVQMYPLGFNAMMTDVNGLTRGYRLQRGEHLRVIPGGKSEEVFAPYIAVGWTLAEVDEDFWAPQGEAFIESLSSTPRGNVIRLSTNLAVSAPVFERQVNGGAWTIVDAESELNGLVGEVRFRARSGSVVSGEVVLRQAAK